jgi:hypothetical protein
MRFTPAAGLLSLALAAVPAAAQLPPPALVSPISGAITDPDAPLLWKAVAGARAYDVELCRDAACSDVTAHATVPNLYSLLHRPVGVTHWRVTALDGEGRRGTPSDTARITVALSIAGTIEEDAKADNDPAGLLPRPGVRLRLYRDGGDDSPSDDDTLVTTTSTDADGHYAFHPAAAGVYWVAADADSLTPAAGLIAGTASTIRAEQTWGGSGALCLGLDGRINRLRGLGPCFGGRRLGNDDATKLSTSKHVTRVAFADASVHDADFGFSFNAVTSIADDAVTGTLRQFVVNANAIRGANAMHFVPVSRAANGKWWSIALATPLPALTDAGTTLDGTTYSAVDPTFVVDINRGALQETVHHVITDRMLASPPRPELELLLSGEHGIVVDAAATIRALALSGARSNVVAHAALTMERAAVGSHPDGSVVAGQDGVFIEGGTAHIDSLFIAGQSNIGLAVLPGAGLTANGLFVTRCGNNGNGAALALASGDADVASSFIYYNDAPAIVVGGNDAAAAAQNNRIRESVVSHNVAGIVLAANAGGTIIEHNDIVWNSQGGVVGLPLAGGAPARASRITQNHYNENGGIPIDLQQKAPLPSPHIDSAAVRTSGSGQKELFVTGTAPAGTEVEVYESYVTSDLRDPIRRERRARDLSSVRESGRTNTIESRDPETADMVPSVGEFNFAATVRAAADGTFTATIPIVEEVRDPNTPPPPDRAGNLTTLDIHDVYHDVRTFAVAAVSLDAHGNTSEFSRRRIVGRGAEGAGR